MSTATRFMTSKLAGLKGTDQQLGKALFDNGILSEEAFDKVLAAQREHGEPFSVAALRVGVATEHDLKAALEQHRAAEVTMSDARPPEEPGRQLEAVSWADGERAEAMRTLRSQLMLRWFSADQVALCVAELRNGDGAGVLAADLACSLAQLGRKTLLIDANLRKPELRSFFGAPAAPDKSKKRKVAAGDVRHGQYGEYGLSDCLNERCNWRDTLYAVPGLKSMHVMFAGSNVPNPQELLSRDLFVFMLENVSDVYDSVIVVSAPLLETADMQIVASRVGGCIVTARRHRSRMADIQRVQSCFEPAATKLVGWVLEG